MIFFYENVARKNIVLKIQFYYLPVLLNVIDADSHFAEQTEQMTTNLTNVTGRRWPLLTINVR